MTFMEELVGLALVFGATIAAGAIHGFFGAIYRAKDHQIYLRGHTARRFTGPTYDPQAER